MHDGPVSRKLADLADNLAVRSGDGHPLSAAELDVLASVLRDLVPLVSTLEDQPVPLRLRGPPTPFRVIPGGKPALPPGAA